MKSILEYYFSLKVLEEEKAELEAASETRKPRKSNQLDRYPIDDQIDALKDRCRREAGRIADGVKDGKWKVDGEEYTTP